MNHSVFISEEVTNALEKNKPVVALESTIISHGMPYPTNVETAFEVEAIVRDGGGIPATVAIFDGQLKIGISHDEVERLSAESHVVKASLRDLGAVLSSHAVASTTVATTVFAAYLSGILVFATGGIGGVHRGLQYDVSADLTALATWPVVVVCAGAKAVLDLPRTLETLETLGVPVLGWRTDAFPEFWTRGTNLPVSAKVDSASEVAAILKSHWSTGLSTGAILGVPIPHTDEADTPTIQAAIEDGLLTAEELGIFGSDVTPFLLNHIAGITSGASVSANVSLISENARIATEVSIELAATK